MFGGGGGGRGGNAQARTKKMKAVKKDIKITLENAYKGDYMKIPHTCDRVCKDCDGKGGSSVQTCPLCKGKGIIEKLVQLGPGMYQQVRSHCGECRGEGKSISEKDSASILATMGHTNIFLPQKGDLKVKAGTLQTIVMGFRIKGTLPTVIDLRFEKPIVTN